MGKSSISRLASTRRTIVDGSATSNLRVVGPLKGRTPDKSNHVHLTPSRFPRLTMPPPPLPLEVSRIYLPRGRFKDSAKLPGDPIISGESREWEFNEPVDGCLIFLYIFLGVFFCVKVKDTIVSMQLFLLFSS